MVIQPEPDRDRTRSGASPPSTNGDGPKHRLAKPWMKVAGMGMELASYTLGLAGIGYVVDLRRHHTTPYATAAGALLGFSYGMFRFVQKASQTH